MSKAQDGSCALPDEERVADPLPAFGPEFKNDRIQNSLCLVGGGGWCGWPNFRVTMFDLQHADQLKTIVDNTSASGDHNNPPTVDISSFNCPICMSRSVIQNKN